MCRHIAWVGAESVPLGELLVEPPHGLYRQAWAPRRQRYGTVNADGFGVGWYAPGDPVPARYRRAGPMWADPSFADLVRVVRSRSVLAAVRDATAPGADGEAAAAPFAAGPWLFSHNGAVAGWPDSVGVLAAGLPSTALLSLEARNDSALVWALLLDRLRSGDTLPDALAGVVRDVAAASPASRLNLLLTDGTTVAATAWGDTLWYLAAPPGAVRTVVASEPYDDDPGWCEVPDRTLLTATVAGVTLVPLTHPPQTARPVIDPLEESPRVSPYLLTRTLPEGTAGADLRADVLDGLTRLPKELPPKWFYDARGSELFEEITRLPEYYPTRTERAILAARAPEIAEATGARTLVELGSGSSEKTRHLLRALGPGLEAYVPVDVSESALRGAADALTAELPGLRVHALVADFTRVLELPGDTPGPRLVAFLGGTLGNLLPAQRAAFLRSVRALLEPGDALLLGTDLVKDEATLVAAYDDAAGVTAEFNKNVLSVLARELGADADPDDFDHVALWDRENEWIEMRLRARNDLTVKIPELGLAVPFGAGEDLRTEVSAKFRQEGVRAELSAAGLELTRWWTDEKGWFGLSLATAV